MAGTLNRVELIGRVGKDPEVKSFQNGGEIVNFSMATSETWKDKQTGEKKEKAEWHNVTVTHEGICKVVKSFVKKGSLIFIEGQMQTRKWQDKDGNDRYSTEVAVKPFNGKLLLLGSKSDDQSSGQSSGQSSQSNGGWGSGSSGGGGTQSGGSPFDSDLDDSIPF